jgi:hypothetical protein
LPTSIMHHVCHHELVNNTKYSSSKTLLVRFEIVRVACMQQHLSSWRAAQRSDFFFHHSFHRYFHRCLQLSGEVT